MKGLAWAHLLALDHVIEGGKSAAFNCGHGHGFSVKEVIETAKKVTGTDLKVEDDLRRAGDPPSLIADSSKLRSVTGWQPEHDDLQFIVQDSWEWERHFPN